MEYKHNIIPDTFGRHIVRLVLLLLVFRIEELGLLIANEAAHVVVGRNI